MKRCSWVKSDISKKYHDEIWGKPKHDDREIFKMLVLETQQAGLSWDTILRKWENYEKAYDDFDPEIVAKYDDKKIEELMNDAGIIRNRMKIESAIRNAKAFLKVEEEYGTFDNYIWKFVDYKPIVVSEIPLSDGESLKRPREIASEISKDLKKRGFTFIGPTIAYAFIQSIGMINNHEADCDFL
jgi:DNA-3-methyladenine glycosylase I